MLALYGLLLVPLVLAQGGALQGAGTGSGPVAGSGSGGAGGDASSASPAASDSASAAAETGTGPGTAASASSTSTTLTPTTPAPTYTATNVVFNSTGASLYSSTTLYTPPASSTTNIFSIVPSGYTNPKAAAPLQNRTNEYASPAWQAAYSKARSYLSSWSLEEKVQLTTGAGWQIGRCLGNIPAVPNQGFPGLCIQDSPLGVRLADFVSAFPAGINVATTWDKCLMYARGYAMGEEFKGKGANVALGPATNIARAPLAGRNWEGFGADPYLAGWAVEQTVKGLQDAGVQATVKHYVGNEVERWREQSSSNINDRAMREIYTHPFLRGVAAGTASVMASYNLINGSWAAQNEKVLNGILKTDFGFEGYVMSDWQGTHSGVLAANNGLDMTMPGDITFGTLTSYFGHNLTVAVYNGSVSEERLDDMAERIMAGWFLVGQDEGFPEVNIDSFRRLGSNNSHVDVRGDHDVLIRKIGAASTVLLKNVNNTLPLHKPRSIMLVGSDMGPSMFGPNGFDDRGGLLGTLAMGWGSGTAEFPYLVDPLQAIARQAKKDGSLLDWWFNDEWLDATGLQKRTPYAEVVIVGIAADSGEGYITVEGNNGDRNDYKPWHNGTEVILAAANSSSNVVVVVHAVGQIDMEPWIDHPNITAVLWAGLPGQESGNSLVDVLYGAYNPSAKLPYTIARNTSDYGIEIDYVEAPANGAPFQPQVNYTEDLLVDYRRFQAKGIKPRFEFGFGMSYTTFELADLSVEYIGGVDGGEEGETGYAGGSDDRGRVEHEHQEKEKATKSSRSRRQVAGQEAESAPAVASVPASANQTATGASATSATSDAATSANASSVIASATDSTSLRASGSAASPSPAPAPAPAPAPEQSPPAAPSKVGKFLSPYFQDPLYRISVRVRNTGSVYGCEVPQLYLAFPKAAGEPPKVLRDFARVTLDVGADGWAEWTLNRYDLSVWDVVRQEWVIPEGEVRVLVGRSSADDEELSWGICPSGKGC